MRIQLAGKRAYVTGATRGIGLAIAKALSEAGADVLAGCRSARDVTVGEPFVSDLSAPPLLPPAPLHILINNAGLWVPDDDPRVAEMWRINLRAVTGLCALFAVQAASGASIVNVSSRASHRGEARYGAYAASKAAVNALTKSLATELGPRGIRVNAVAPGWVVTDMTREALPETGLPEPIPLGRVAQPQDVAGPVLFLCSELARYVTGTVLDVNGGSYLH